MVSGPLQEQAYRFSFHIVLFSKSLIEERKEYILSKQLMKAGTSVGANIEEAQQAQSRADFISKLSISLKEASESRFWLRLITDSGYSQKEKTDPLLQEVTSIISILVRSIKTAKKNRE